MIATGLTWTDLELNRNFRVERPATKRLGYDTDRTVTAVNCVREDCHIVGIYEASNQSV